MGRIIQKVLIFCDYLRQPYEFKLKHDERNGTQLGGILSIIFGSVLIFYFAASYIQVDHYLLNFKQLEQEGNKLHIGDRKMISDEQLQETDVIFTLGFRTEEETGNVKNISYKLKFIYYNRADLNGYIQIQVFAINKTNELNIQELKMIDCDSQILSNSERQIGSLGNPEKIMCVSGRFNISGLEDATSNSFLRIIINKCNGRLCKNNLDSFIYKLKLQVFLISNKIGLDIQTGAIIQDNYTTVINQQSISEESELNIYYQKLQIQEISKSISSLITGGTESRIIGGGASLKDWTKQKLFPDYICSRVNLTENNLIIVNLRLYPEIGTLYAEKTDIIIKMFDALSLFGGLFTIFFTFLSLFYKFYQRHKIYEHLMNYNLIFDLTQLETQSKRLKSRSTPNFLLKNFSYEVSFSYPSYIYLKLKKNLMKILKIPLKQEKDLEVFQEAQTLLKKELDLTHILQKLYEIDKLKMLLMDDQQLCLFNSLARPVLQIESLKDQSPKTRKTKHRNTVYINGINGGLISFNQGFFRSQQIENDGPLLLEKFFSIMNGQNKYKELNQKFLELMKMNRKLYRILDVQYRLSKCLQCNWKAKIYASQEITAKVKFQKCVLRLNSYKRNGTYPFFLKQLEYPQNLTNSNKDSLDQILVAEAEDDYRESPHQRIQIGKPNIQSVITTRKQRQMQQKKQSARTYIQKKNIEE